MISKTIFFINFCVLSTLSYDSINHSIEKQKESNLINRSKVKYKKCTFNN